MTHLIPDKFRVTQEQRDSFIQESRELIKKFRHAVADTFIYDKTGQKRWTQERYKEGRLRGVLDMTFHEFSESCDTRPWWERGHQPRYHTWDRVGCPFRNGKSYRKNTDHEPKEGDSKQIWREYKQMNRDKSKDRGWHLRPRDGISYWKNRSARDHRAWVKDRLQNGDYEAFHDKEYEIFINPWAYD